MDQTNKARAAFTRHTIVARLDCGVHRHRDFYPPVFVTVKWDDKRLSITGVEGPKANGDAEGK